MIRTKEAKDVMIEATRAGIHKESIGQWLNSAIRSRRLNDTKREVDCLRAALEIHNTWGTKVEDYSMSERTLERTTQRLSEIFHD